MIYFRFSVQYKNIHLIYTKKIKENIFHRFIGIFWITNYILIIRFCRMYTWAVADSSENFAEKYYF